MRICGSMRSALLVFSLACIWALPRAGWAQATQYLDHEGLTGELQALVGNSDLATMTSLGSSLEGRDIWMVEVGDPSGSPLDTRPGILVVGNLEGDHLVGSQLALEAIRYLIQNRGEDTVRSLLSTRVFYFFPRLNPDGAEAMFSSVTWNRKTNTLPWDEDNDGMIDEDGPEDLNGDGYISVMRVPDPSGRYMVDPADPRLMKRADPTKGEIGGYKIYWEGTDEDEDGFINEDGPGGVDLNRNFQHAYPYWEGDAGPHMVSEAESRAIMDFAIAHKNIAAFLTFGPTDNLVTPPNARGELADPSTLKLSEFAEATNADVFDVGVFSGGGASGFRGRGRGGGGGGSWLRGAQPGRDNDPSSGTRPATTVAGPDQVYFKAVSDAYKEITGIEAVPVHREAEGALFQYGYFHFGVPSFSTPGWGLPKAEGETERAPGQGRTGGESDITTDARLLASLEAAGVEAFIEWGPFQHPGLGEVEIGGFLPYVTHNPPPNQLPDWGEKHGQFLVKLGSMLPSVRIAESEVTDHGGGVFTISVEVENIGFFPTSTQHGVRSRSVGPTSVQIQVDADAILTGADKTFPVGVLNGSGNREKVTWVILGRAGSQVEIRLISQKAGHDSITVTLG